MSASAYLAQTHGLVLVSNAGEVREGSVRQKWGVVMCVSGKCVGAVTVPEEEVNRVNINRFDIKRTFGRLFTVPDCWLTERL